MVYLIHFHSRYRHAGHYVGWTEEDNLDARIEEHRRGNGARLMAVVREAGIDWEVARVWPGYTRKDERRIKNSGHIPRYCPICREHHARGENHV